MSIPVDLADLDRTLERFGAGYLLTVGPTGRVKAVSARPVPADGALTVLEPGRGSTANVAERPDVTLLYPPPDAAGHSLLVDGTAEVVGDDVVVRPTGAVLHRPAEPR